MQLKSVTEVTRYIKALIDEAAELDDLWIEGEVSNFTRAASGHCYFTLKDSEATIRCVMWRNVASRMSWAPDQGDLVDAHGLVSVYERGGAYQFYADELIRGGIGARWQAFLALKERLEAEGLFSAERRRPLPKWPRRVGVVTSPSGAALRDILNVLGNRYPLVEVVLSPSAVQGEAAPLELVRALDALNALPDIDVIIIGRGGGSLEDLWAFNDEGVARTISQSRVPVVSGVGHETDFTIADFVADLRTPTPSTAAAAIVPDSQALGAQIGEYVEALISRTVDRIGRARELLETRVQSLALQDPRKAMSQDRQTIDALMRRIHSAVTHAVALRRTRVQGAAARLIALDPGRVLDRGYAVVQDRQTGARVRSIQQTDLDRVLGVHVSDGRIDVRVEGVTESTSTDL